MTARSPYQDNGLASDEKRHKIEGHFREILTTLGIDLQDDSMSGTPKRVAKMFVDELFSGLQEQEFPKITTQENKFHYDQMLVEANISVQTVCEHHFVPILGACHVAYIPGEKILGLSKFNRVVHYFCRRPQVQERLTHQIMETLKEVLHTENVAVVIDAVHLCVRMRGIKDHGTITRTSALSGVFRNGEVRTEFLSSIPTTSDLKLF